VRAARKPWLFIVTYVCLAGLIFQYPSYFQTAGALGYEKDAKTLEALFGTQLTSGDIVAGKFLGRLALLMRILFLPLPLIVLLTLLGELNLFRVFLGLLVLGGISFLLSAACMLSAVWTRRTSDAILACYAAIIVAFLLYQGLVSNTRLSWLNPIIFVHEALAVRDPVQRAGFIVQMVALAIMGTACLLLAARWLRPTSSRQAEKRPSRWL